MSDALTSDCKVRILNSIAEPGKPDFIRVDNGSALMIKFYFKKNETLHFLRW